jgi:hypothetical protein
MTRSAKEGDAEAVEERPTRRDRPSEEEGLKRNHSGSSSLTARWPDEAGENREALGIRLDERVE